MENKATPGTRAVLVINALHNRAGGYAPRCYYTHLWGRAIPVVTGRHGADRGEPLRVRALLRGAAAAFATSLDMISIPR